MFEIHEERLRQLVKGAETPVLGLLGTLLSSEARDAIRRDVAVSPSARAYAERLEEFPALFAIWLAEHVMLGLGQDGHFSLYPHLQRAIGVNADLTLMERERLWRAFRRASLKLGIQPLARVTGPHFMVDEYVRQAGVPIAFADDLAIRMLSVARRLGLPDEDDQEGLLTWQAALLNKLVPPFSITARKAVERDSIGYYTRAFVLVHLNGGRATGQGPLELAFATAFTADGRTAIRSSAIPELLYRDGVLGILFHPSTLPTVYGINCGTHADTVYIDTQSLFRPLPSGLHQQVTVEREDGERVISAKLWPDELSNRLLIFNAEGRLRAAAQLAQAEAVELAPGRYLALARFKPSNSEDWDEVSESPLLIEVPLQVRPGLEQVLMNGPASVLIQGANQPSVALSGMAKGSLEGVEFWYGHLQVAVEVPAEWLGSDKACFEVRVIHGERCIALPLQLDSAGRASITADSAIADLSLLGGIWRVVFELARVGEARTLHRQSILFWSGLKRVSYGLRFTYERQPENLLSAACTGVNVGASHTEPGDDQSRVIRLAFDVGRGRVVHLSWHRPGVFVEVQVSAKDGATKTFPRRLGAEETVSLTSTKMVVVSASEPGFITLGSMRTFVDFSRRANKGFPASFLASRLEAGARTLTYETESGNVSVPLLVLTQPHVATSVKVERLANLFEVKVAFSGEPTDVSVRGRELSTGREASGEHELMAGTWHVNDLARMQVYGAAVGSTYVLHILIDVESLRTGVWVLNFLARIGGVWGALQDADEGRIGVALAVNDLGKELQGKEVVADSVHLELPAVLSRLTRLNEHFRHCWSPACWDQQSWLTPYFSALIERVREHEKDYVTELVDMAIFKAAEDVRPGFLSMQWAPALLPQMFSQPRASYKRVNEKAHPLSVALRAFPELRGAISPAFGTVLHPIAAMAFRNVTKIMQGLRPKEFNIATYRQALRQATLEVTYELDDELFLPKEGELLGPVHLAHAWRDLERGLLNSQLMSNNRKSTALAVARKLGIHHGVFDGSAPAGLIRQSLLLQVGDLNGVQLEDVEQLKWEQMEHVANACAWLAWYCRLEQRREGSLSNFLEIMALLRKQVEVPGGSVTDCLAYYMQVAPAMFSFYLLLWELVLTVELDSVIQNV